MKKNILVPFLLLFLIIGASFTYTQKAKSKTNLISKDTLSIKDNHTAFNFLIVSDWGWNGYKQQQAVADAMASLADSIDPKFIVSCGDNFQVQGVASTQDPLWTYNFENVYKNISLQINWFPVLGNHDYKGNTQAQIDYSKISRRWRMESHYYSFVAKINDSISARLIFLDTPPLVDEYYKKPGYPDVFKQDSAKQILWLKDVLSNSKEQWKIVFGHHPVYSASHKHGNTPELIRRLKPLFEKYNVQFYVCGHDHDMQHLCTKNGNVNYIVTGTGGEPRPSASNDLTLFSKSVPGFMQVSLYGDSLQMRFIDNHIKTIYSIKKQYKK